MSEDKATYAVVPREELETDAEASQDLSPEEQQTVEAQAEADAEADAIESLPDVQERIAKKYENWSIEELEAELNRQREWMRELDEEIVNADYILSDARRRTRRSLPPAA